MFKWLAIITMALWGQLSLAEDSSCDALGDRCTFVLFSASGGERLVINPQRAATRLSPFSTFKIPNTAIALETGVVPNLEDQLSFDRERYPVEDWWPQRWYAEPLTLPQAFRISAVPIYQEIARKVGAQRMQRYVDEFDYGNRDISSGIDSFWLAGSLEISALEQVEFLQQVYEGQTPALARNLDLIKTTMLVEEKDGYRLYAKTGAGYVGEQSALGWYVGFVENASGVHYFALNVTGRDFAEIQETRLRLVRAHLAAAGVFPG